MGKKYFDTKEGTLESSVLNVWAEAAKKSESMDKVNPKALKKDFDDRKDKDIDNDGDVDDSDEYLHNRRKTVSKAVKKEEVELDEASVTVDLENDDPKLLKDIKRMGLKIKDNGSSGNDGYNEYTITGPDAKLKAGGKKFGWDQQVESYEIGTDEYRDHALDTTPGQSLTWGTANAYKQASMKEALAKVWGLDEKKLDKSEESDIIAPVKGKKSMTGGKVADVDVDPEMKKEDK